MNFHLMRNGVVLTAGLWMSTSASVNAQPPLPTYQVREAHANVLDVQESAPAASTKAKVTTPKAALLPIANRQAIKDRLSTVRAEIEKAEDEMFALTDKHYDSLVTSRDRWHSELDRVQTEIRLADKDLAEAATRSEQMNLRMAELVKESELQFKDDAPLATLGKKLKSLKTKYERIETDPNIRAKSLKGMLESAMAEIIDTEMEIAQREESLRLSYKGGQADQLKKELKELEVDAEVKKSAKKVLQQRFQDLQDLSEDITAFARLERKVDELQILHRKLSELNAQQEVELLKSAEPQKKEVPVETPK